MIGLSSGMIKIIGIYFIGNSAKLLMVEIFLHSPTRIVECVSEYTFLSPNNNKQTTNKTRIKKCKRNQRRKENISGKLIKKNKIAVAQVKIFLVIRISGNKSILFYCPYSCFKL